MAWKSSEEQAMQVVKQHLEEANLEMRQAIIRSQEEFTFPDLAHPRWQRTQWVTHNEITYVTTWGEGHLLNNLKVAMIKELLGLGPHHYCIIDNKLPEMDNRILLLLYFLPSAKLCFYSKQGKMRNISLGSPWKEIVKGISERDILLDKDLARILHFFQRFEIWADFGGS